MVMNSRVLGVGAAVLLAWSGASAVPAQAAEDGYTSWATHDSAADAADDTVDNFAAGSVHVRQLPEGITVWTGPMDDRTTSLTMSTVGYGALVAGTTYTSPGVRREDPSSKDGFLSVFRDNLMCGTDRNRADDGEWGSDSRPGSFTVQELEHDSSGAITRFRATYELNCPSLGGPRGAEGSVAFNSTAPAGAVPRVVTPGPVTGFHATNVGPSSLGETSTTLSWIRPVGASDVVLDVVGSKDPANLPVDSGTNPWRGGILDRWTDPRIESMVTRTYRVTPRGPSGRLGEPTTVTVMGTRWLTLHNTERIQVGEEANFSGRLRESPDYGAQYTDQTATPGIGGLRVDLCRQPSHVLADDICDVVATTTTASDGYYAFAVRPEENSDYNVRLLAGPANVANVGRVANAALVSPQTDLDAPGGEVATTRARGLRRGSVIRFSTSRARAGSNGTARLQRLDGHTWRTLVTKRIATSGPRRMAIPYRERKAGSHSYRVVKSPDSRHVTGYSRVVRVRVR